MNFRVRRVKKPQVMIISLVDVVLQLVFFLLLTTSFKTVETGIVVNVPSVETSAEPAAGGIMLELDRTGKISIDGKPVIRDDLDVFFREEALQSPLRKVFLRADSGARHGDVVAILDLARRHDLKRLTIAAVPERAD